jgi:hypothetical protein
VVRQPKLSTAKTMHDARRGRGRRAAHRSAQRTVLRHAPSVSLRGVRRGVASELNRSPARTARDAGGALVAQPPVRGCPSPPASVGPVFRPHRPHPVPGRENRRAASLERIIFVRKTQELAA